MKSQGIDFGGYTIWKRNAIRPGVQVDFVICGIGWGNAPNTTWEHNKPEIMKEDRRIIYQFFHHAPAWEGQADFILKEYEDVNAHAVFVDWERSKWGVREDLNMSKQANYLWRILNKVRNNVDGRVGGYSNFNDYWLAQKYVSLNEFPWWFADPDRFPSDPPGSLSWWDKINRPFGDYVFDQWDWKAYAPTYGAVNNKKSMDLTQCKYDLAWLDEWLGIEIAPPENCDGIWNQALDVGKQALEDKKK